MREKKFRYTFKHVATGNIEKKIYTLSQLEERNAKELSPCFNHEFGYGLIGRDDFTGLKDKHGKEIFEGDILTDHGDEGPLYIEYSTVHAAFVFVDKFDPPGTTLYTTTCISYGDFEIIGNIYENPELLEATA